MVQLHVGRLARRAEAAYDGEESSLRVLCRVDVGMWWYRNDTLSYFVRDVKRGSIGLLSGPQELSVDVGDKLLKEFSRWLRDRDSTIY